MIRQSPHLLSRFSLPLRTIPSRRFLSTAPPAQKSRSWKSFTARLGLAFGAVYYYNTSQLFAEEPPFSIPPPQSPTEETSLQTLESIAIKNRTPPPPTPALAASRPSGNTSQTPTSPTNETLAASRSPENASPSPKSSSKKAPSPPRPLENTNSDLKPPAHETHASSHPPEHINPTPTPRTNESLLATEAEASQEGAFNEETGEINWDCPCLGGMAHGPCGEQFRAAFSCFVYSKEEPKGMDCIQNFKNMQDCFHEHPDVYGAELDDDDEGQEGEHVPAPAPAPVSVEGGEVPAAALSAESAPEPSPASQPPPSTSSSIAGDNTQQGSADEGTILVPKAAHDATSANTEK